MMTCNALNGGSIGGLVPAYDVVSLACQLAMVRRQFVSWTGSRFLWTDRDFQTSAETVVEEGRAPFPKHCAPVRSC